MDKENVYIIIPVHNRKAITLQCLDTLEKNGDRDKYHVIVVDDGSTDGTSEAIKSLYPDVEILAGDGNLWWTGAIKKGMEYAYEHGAEYLIWLNDDCLVESHTFDDLVSFCRIHVDSVIGCQGVDFKDHNRINFGGKRKQWMHHHMIDCPRGESVPCDLLSGNLVCIPRAVINKINYPNPYKVPHYGGDSSYLIHARKSGFKIFVDNKHLILNISHESNISPQRWLLKEGHPLDIINLLFNRYSCYSWQVWLELNQVEYGRLIGIISFLAYYTIYFFVPISLISILRFLPIKTRYRLSQLKYKLLFKQ